MASLRSSFVFCSTELTATRVELASLRFFFYFSNGPIFRLQICLGHYTGTGFISKFTPPPSTFSSIVFTNYLVFSRKSIYLKKKVRLQVLWIRTTISDV